MKIKDRLLALNKKVAHAVDNMWLEIVLIFLNGVGFASALLQERWVSACFSLLCAGVFARSVAKKCDTLTYLKRSMENGEMSINYKDEIR